MPNCRQIVGMVALAIGLSIVCSSNVEAQWRGRYVRRDGLFHVEKYHWGNGITPTGALVINHALDVLAPIAQQALNRDADTRGVSAQERNAILESDRQKLAEAQAIRAKTEQLYASFIGTNPPTGPGGQLPVVDPSADPFQNWPNNPGDPPQPLGLGVDPSNPFKAWGNRPGEAPPPLE